MDCLVEKPLTIFPSEAKKLCEYAEKKKRILMVNQTRRFFPNSLNIKKILHEGHLGKLKSLHFSEGADFGWASVSDFYLNGERSGVIADLGSHILDLLCWWFHEVKFVSCWHNGISGPESFCRIKLLIDNQAPAIIKMSRAGRLRNSFELDFEKGKIKADSFGWNFLELHTEKGNKQHYTTQDKSVESYQNFAQLVLSEFINSSKYSVNSSDISAKSCLKTIDLIDKCYKQAQPKRTHTWEEHRQTIYGIS